MKKASETGRICVVAVRELDGPARAGLAGLSVLVVDDDATERRIVGNMLEAWDMVPTLADGGLAALAAMREARDGTPFTVVLLDGDMPGMDAFTVAAQLKDHANPTAPPVLMLTSSGEPPDSAQHADLGIAAYLTKPVSSAALYDAILGVIRRRSVAVRLDDAGDIPASLDELLSRVGGDLELLKEVLVLFREDCPRLMQAIREGLHNGDFNAVSRAAHALKGSASNFDAADVTDLAHLIEARAAECDLEASRSTFAILEVAVTALLSRLAVAEGLLS